MKELEFYKFLQKVEWRLYMSNIEVDESNVPKALRALNDDNLDKVKLMVFIDFNLLSEFIKIAEIKDSEDSFNVRLFNEYIGLNLIPILEQHIGDVCVFLKHLV